MYFKIISLTRQEFRMFVYLFASCILMRIRTRVLWYSKEIGVADGRNRTIATPLSENYVVI